jgi:hypothetical protein
MPFSYFWTGTNKAIPYGVYIISATDVFTAKFALDTHELRVYFCVNHALVIDKPFHTLKCVTLWRDTNNYNLPGRFSSDEIATFVVNGLSNFLMSTKDPIMVDGMTHIPEHLPNIWKTQHDILFNRLSRYAAVGWKGFKH